MSPIPRPEQVFQEREVVPFAQAQVAASTTWKFFKPKGRSFRVDSVRYVNPTGLATDASNYYTLLLKNGSTTVATIANTNSSGGAAIAADTFADGTLSATDANLVLAPDDVLSLVATKTGTQTLPAGHLVVEGRYI